MESPYYRLEGKIPVPCDDLIEWAAWFESADRTVARDRVGAYLVSTVFIGGPNLPLPGFEPLLFETAVFIADEVELSGRRMPPLSDYFMKRALTWELALEAHQEAIQWAKAN